MNHLSISQIKLFKACRRAYELRYVEGLIPAETASALQTGISYHEKLEQLYRDGYFEVTDYTKESAMAMAYKEYIYPKFQVKAVEEWCRYEDGGVPLIGRVDGMAEDGNLVEHKTTSLTPLEYEYNLQWDEQILAYMLMTGARKVWYTVCRKPTIRQKKNESDEEFFHRMVEWYDEDTDSKIKLILVERTDEEVEAFKKSFQNIRDDISLAERYGDFYRNTCHCNVWGRRCEYSSVCLHYDPEQEYVEFVRKEE